MIKILKNLIDTALPSYTEVVIHVVQNVIPTTHLCSSRLVHTVQSINRPVPSPYDILKIKKLYNAKQSHPQYNCAFVTRAAFFFCCCPESMLTICVYRCTSAVLITQRVKRSAQHKQGFYCSLILPSAASSRSSHSFAFLTNIQETRVH